MLWPLLANGFLDRSMIDGLFWESPYLDSQRSQKFPTKTPPPGGRLATAPEPIHETNPLDAATLAGHYGTGRPELQAFKSGAWNSTSSASSKFKCCQLSSIEMQQMRFFHMYRKPGGVQHFIISFSSMLVVYIDRRIRIIGRQPVLSKCHALETSTIRRLCLQLMQNVGKNAMS